MKLQRHVFRDGEGIVHQACVACGHTVDLAGRDFCPLRPLDAGWEGPWRVPDVDETGQLALAWRHPRLALTAISGIGMVGQEVWLHLSVSSWGPKGPILADDLTVQWVLREFGLVRAEERRTNPAHVARNFFELAEP